MASETATGVERPTGSIWLGGALAGIVGGAVFGAMMHMMMTEIMEMAIPGMYGLEPGLTVGWLLHLFHSAVFGLVYVAIAQVGVLREYAHRVTTGTGVGIGYGAVIWLVAATFVMPFWVGAMTPMAPPVPDVNPMSLVGHVVYGAILGALYPVLAEAL